jgi:hypothetical protein
MKMLQLLCKLTLLVSIFFISAQSYAQTGGIIKGHVHDTIFDIPLSYAQVSIDDKNIRGIANEEGNFILENVPAGVHHLRVSISGYRDSILTVPVLDGSEIELYIEFPPYCKYNRKDKTCQLCGKGDKVIPVVYGYPSKKGLRLSKRGKIALGGCIVSDCDPQWYCKRDKLLF